MVVNERFIWATEILDLQPTNDMLEIGCGAGIFAEQIAGKLTAGELVAVDKSAAMIKMAVRRNQNFINKKRINFLMSDFAKTNIGSAVFDKIVAFNVNVFWKDPSQELALIRRYLRRDGQLYLFYQMPYEATRKDAVPIITQLKNNAFTVEDLLFKKMKPTSSFCIIAKP